MFSKIIFKKLFSTFAILTFFNECFSQEPQFNFVHPTELKDTIYLDIDDKKIGKSQFYNKLNTSLFSSLVYKNDSLIIKRIRYSYVFGKIEDHTKKQLLYTLESRNKVDVNKIMVIHYKDTLKRISEFADKNKLKFSKDSMYHEHIISHKNFIKYQKKCVRRFNRYKKSNVYHFFGFNNGHPTTFKKLNWYEDNYHLINKIFRDKYGRFNTIIINPDGTFYGYNYMDGNNLIFSDIIRGKNWDRHYKEFLYKLDYLSSI